MAIERRLGQHINHPNPDPVERAEQINKVWELRRTGKSFPKIAEIMGCSVSTAHKLFREGRMMNAPPGAEEERILAIQQMELLWETAMETLERSVLDPELTLKALLTLDKLMKSRRELLGLDAPTKFQGSIHNFDQKDIELQEMIVRMREQAEAQDDKRQVSGE